MIVVAGGVMPDEDVAALKQMGVAEIMLQDTPPQAIVDDSRVWSTSAAPGSADGRLDLPTRLQRSYRPEADSRYWFPHARPCTRRARGGDPGRLRDVCRYAYAHAPFYRRQWDAAGFHPPTLSSLEDFETRSPW